jgi:putative endonuclease
MIKPWFVYIIRCADNTYYTGISPDVAKRITKHRMGLGAKYTRGKSPLVLVYVKKYANVSEALKAERAIKRSSGLKAKLLDTFQQELKIQKDEEIREILLLTNII